MWTLLLKVDHNGEHYPALKESYPEKHGVNQANKAKQLLLLNATHMSMSLIAVATHHTISSFTPNI